MSTRITILTTFALICMAFCAPVQATPVTDGLVVYYDGNISGTVTDISGNANHGSALNVGNGVNSSTGVSYITFNGVNSSISVPVNDQTQVLSPMTVEFIGSVDQINAYCAIVEKYITGDDGWYMVTGSSSNLGKVRTGYGLGNGLINPFNSNSVLNAGQVYDITMTYDGNTAVTYINGVSDASRTGWNSPVESNGYHVEIGKGGRDFAYLNGKMYGFRMYNRALNATEIQQNYQNDKWRYTARETPALTWFNPSDIIYGTELSSVQLNAESSVPGTFVYTPNDGAILEVGTHTLNVEFTPTDSTNYTNATANVTINVMAAEPEPESQSITDGQVTDGLKVCYDGNSVSGNTIIDLSGNGNNGTITALTQGTDESGYTYYNFNGGSSTVTIPNSVSIPNTSPITIEFVGSVNDFEKYGIIASRYGNSQGWMWSTNSGAPYDRLRFASYCQSGFQSYTCENGIEEDQVYDMVLVYDGSAVTTYINGARNGDDIRTWNSPFATTTNNITIGAGSGFNSTNMNMYAFNIYNKALSQAEIEQNYFAHQVAYSPVLVNDDFEDGFAKFWNLGGVGATDHSATFSTNHSVSGTRALRIELREDDPDMWGSRRCEFSSPVEPLGDSRTYEFSTFIPNDTENWIPDRTDFSETIFQVHQTSDAGDTATTCGPAFSLACNTDENGNQQYLLTQRSDNAKDTVTYEQVTRTYADLGNWTEDRGQWVHWEVDAKWGWNAGMNPHTYVYKNDELVYSSTIPNTFNDTIGMYTQAGIYKYVWKEYPGMSLVDSRTIYFDDFKITQVI